MIHLLFLLGVYKQQKMQYIKILFLSVFILLGVSSNAQFVEDVKSSGEQRVDSLGSVRLIQDDRIKELLDTDKMISSKDPGFSGYRIQIFSGRSTDREKAFKIKEEFKKIIKSAEK